MECNGIELANRLFLNFINFLLFFYTYWIMIKLFKMKSIYPIPNTLVKQHEIL